MAVAHDAVPASFITQFRELGDYCVYFDFQGALEELPGTIANELIERGEWTDDVRIRTVGHGAYLLLGAVSFCRPQGTPTSFFFPVPNFWSYLLLRLVEGLAGEVNLHVSFRPAFDYARASTETTSHLHGATARAGRESLILGCPVALRC